MNRLTVICAYPDGYGLIVAGQNNVTTEQVLDIWTKGKTTSGSRVIALFRSDKEARTWASVMNDGNRRHKPPPNGPKDDPGAA